MIFNDFFITVNFYGFYLPFNLSVIFFCVCFYILDIVTELYDAKIASKIIYAKILFQFVFVFFGYLAMDFILLKEKLATVFDAAPKMFIDSMIATFIAYKITILLMAKTKRLYNKGQYMALRYFTSALPG